VSLFSIPTVSGISNSVSNLGYRLCNVSNSACFLARFGDSDFDNF
jgi:hypothetical protein